MNAWARAGDWRMYESLDHAYLISCTKGVGFRLYLGNDIDGVVEIDCGYTAWLWAWLWVGQFVTDFRRLKVVVEEELNAAIEYPNWTMGKSELVPQDLKTVESIPVPSDLMTTFNPHKLGLPRQDLYDGVFRATVYCLAGSNWTDHVGNILEICKLDPWVFAPFPLPFRVAELLNIP